MDVGTSAAEAHLAAQRTRNAEVASLAPTGDKLFVIFHLLLAYYFYISSKDFNIYAFQVKKSGPSVHRGARFYYCSNS